MEDFSPRSEVPTPRARSKKVERESTKPASTPPSTMDLFGKSRLETNIAVEKELEEIEKEKEKDLRKKQNAQERQSSVGRKTPTDTRDRKSPANRLSPADAFTKKVDEQPVKDRKQSLLDIITGEAGNESRDEKKVPKPKERHVNGSKNRSSPQVGVPEQSKEQVKESQKQLSADSSSVCEELKEDPLARTKKLEQQ